MANFEIAYKQYIQPNEGGYVNDPDDKGGETYAGIARVYFPDWKGWTYIDFVKRTKGPISWNTKFQDIQYLVDDFYLNYWNGQRLTEINSQDLANLLFDYYVHSNGHAIRAIQTLVHVSADGQIGPLTINAINSTANIDKLHDALKAERKAFLEDLIKKDPSQKKFESNWLSRVARFPNLVIHNGIGLVGIIAVAAITAYFIFSSTPEKKNLIHKTAYTYEK